MTNYANVSLWLDSMPGRLTPRSPLPGPKDVDVAIIGGGFTGLWTAYYLQNRDPMLRVAVLESEIAGYGASGRNGGWCSALYPVEISTLSREAGRTAAIDQYHAMVGAVDEVIRVAAVEEIDADIARGGTITLARSAAQLERAQAETAQARQFNQELVLLDADTARQRLNATKVLGATYTRHCAVMQPAKLARGLADVVEARGASIYEQTRVLDFESGVAHTEHGDVRAKVIIRATEGYTAQLPGLRRALAPVYSLIIATEPLPDSVWDEIGLRERETFSDHRHLIIYGQRTADGRMVFGGRGAPYHFGSRILPEYDRAPKVFSALEQTLIDLFPVLRGTPITHRWGGPIGVARDWHASVGLDASTGLGWAGGYVGDGVSTTNLAGRTLADLITDHQSPLTALPWVGHHSRKWEPEPLRWLGANAGLQAMTWADNSELRTGKPSRLAGFVTAMIGR